MHRRRGPRFRSFRFTRSNANRAVSDVTDRFATDLRSPFDIRFAVIPRGLFRTLSLPWPVEAGYLNQTASRFPPSMPIRNAAGHAFLRVEMSRCREQRGKRGKARAREPNGPPPAGRWRNHLLGDCVNRTGSFLSRARACEILLATPRNGLPAFQREIKERRRMPLSSPFVAYLCS